MKTAKFKAANYKQMLTERRKNPFALLKRSLFLGRNNQSGLPILQFSVALNLIKDKGG